MAYFVVTGDLEKNGVYVYKRDVGHSRGCHHCYEQSHQGHDWQG